jgi:hypothetical protein
MGNPQLKKELEDKLKDKIDEGQGEDGNEVAKPPKEPNEATKEGGGSAETVHDLNQFNTFTKKKYTKEHLMQEAERQGLTWKTTMNDGTPLPKNSSIMWMHAHQAIVNHIKAGNTFEVGHNEKDVDKRMAQDDKDSIHKHFLKLLEKHGSKDAMMEWARKNGITWKENTDPSINWMYAVKTIKNELAKGKMVDGIRTRQKGAMEEANTVVTDQIKQMVGAYGQKHGKSKVMKRAEELGITFDRLTKKGETLPENSNILWMRAHEAIAKHIAQGNSFTMGDERDTGITSKVGDYGGVKVTQHQGLALDRGKRNSQNKEPRLRKWAIKAITTDYGVDEATANTMYDQFMQKAREARVMLHFDPTEKLTNGVNMLDQFTSDGHFKNDYQLKRGVDKEHRESNERDLFGDEFDEASESERPNYGVVDLMGQGLKSHKWNGDVAFVLKDDAKKRVTGSALDSNSIPYGEDGQWVRSMEDPHHLVLDRWRSRWQTVNKPDAQRKRMFDSVLNGTPNHDDHQFFETHVHGGVDFGRDVDHLLIPQHWNTDKQFKDTHDKVKQFATQFGIPLKYEG